MGKELIRGKTKEFLRIVIAYDLGVYGDDAFKIVDCIEDATDRAKMREIYNEVYSELGLDEDEDEDEDDEED